MPQETFLVTVPPQQLRLLRGREVTPAHLAYRMGPGPRLLRAGTPARGGWMVLSDCGFQGLGSRDILCQEIVTECRSREFSGVILDFDRRLPPLEQLAARLDGLLPHRGLTLAVPEAYGHCTQRARVIIPVAISGGTLRQRLEEAGQQFGRDRITLSLEAAAEDFLLPSPTGCGTPLSSEQLAGLRERLRPSVFFSQELCARYFTYMENGSGHFVLFDDGDTLKRKTDAARQSGVTSFLLPWTILPLCAGVPGFFGGTPPKTNRPAP